MYYIYHIVGKKIGCSENPKMRVKLQKEKSFEILETHTDINIASNREIELQKQYGYEVDTIPYSHSNKLGKKYWKLGLDTSHKNNSKAIKVFNYFTKHLVNEFPSLWNACQILNIHQANATAVIKGKRNHVSGYYFEYK